MISDKKSFIIKIYKLLLFVLNNIWLFIKKAYESKLSISLKYIIPIVSIVICLFKIHCSNYPIEMKYFYIIFCSFLSTNVSIACTILTENMVGGTYDNIAKETGGRYLVIIFSLVIYVLLEMNEFGVMKKPVMIVIAALTMLLTLFTIWFTFGEIRQEKIIGSYEPSEETKRKFDEALEKKTDNFENSKINLEGKLNG